MHAEPNTTMWDNFYVESNVTRVRSLLLGCCLIGLALALWAGLFYLPWAYFVMAFSYKSGTQPNALTGMFFSIMIASATLLSTLCATLFRGMCGLDGRMTFRCVTRSSTLLHASSTCS